LLGDRAAARIGRAGARDQGQVDSAEIALWAETAVGFPEDPLGSIAPNGAADPAAGHDQDSTLVCFVHCMKEHDVGGSIDSTGLVESPNVGSSPKRPVGVRTSTQAAETVKRFRPLARRLAKTLRPLAVFIRRLNPCTLRRRLTCGWNVLFMSLLAFRLKAADIA